MMMRVLAGLLAFLCAFVAVYSQIQEACTNRPLDVFFIIDGSRSVRESNFQVVKNYVRNFTTIFELGPDKVQVGVIQYGSLVKEEIKLNQYHDLGSLQDAIDRIEYMKMGTMTGEALKFYVTTALREEHGARVNNPNVHSIAIIITDGRSQDYHRGTVSKWQKRAKELGVEIYAIGVGRKAKESELWEMASKPKLEHKYRVRNFDAIRKIDVEIRRQILVCDIDECAESLDDCEQICTNTMSSYTCSCNEGFVLQEDKRSCQTILIPNPSSITVDDITHTAAVATWEINNDQGFNIDHYELVYTRTDGNGVEITENVYGQLTSNLIDLDSSTTYDVSVRAIGADGQKSATVSTTFTTLTLGQTTVELTKPTLTTLTAEWMPAGGDGLTGYEVIYREVVDTNGVGVEPAIGAIVERVGPEALSKVLNGLKPGSLYDVTVVPLYGELTGSRGNNERSTDSLEAPRVVIVSSGLIDLTLRWSEINYQAQSWVVDIVNLKNDEAMTFNVGSDELHKVFSDLMPYTEYAVHVVGVVEEEGELFNSPAGETIGKTGELTAPDIVITDQSLSTITAEWTEINIPVSLWVIGISNNKTGEYEEFTMEVDIRENKFLHLTPSTDYTIQVRAKLHVNSVEIESPVAADSAQTMSLSAPDVEITNSGFNSLELKWSAINFGVDSWEVTYYRKGEKKISQSSIEVSSETQAVTLTDLTPSSQYIVEVSGIVSEGLDTFTSPVGKTSGFTAPLPPRNIEVIDQRVSTLVSTFDPSLSLTSHYVAKCIPPDGSIKRSVVARFISEFEMICENLDPSTCYTIEVQSFYNESIETSGCTLIPVPTGLEVVEPTPSSLEVVWDRQDPLLFDVYELYYESLNATNSVDSGKVEIASDQDRFVIENLQPNTEYSIDLVSVKGDRVSLVLRDRGTTLSETIDAEVMGIGFTSFNVTWETSVVPHLQYYELIVKGPGVYEKYELVSSVINHEITLLQPNTTYNWSVSAVYSKSSSPKTVKETTTLAMPAIGPISFSDVTDSSFVINWEHDDEVMLADYYIVTYGVISQPRVTIDGVGEKSLRLDELNAGTPYNVTVQAIYSNNMTSEIVDGVQITDDAAFADFTQASCSCSTYLSSQEQIESAIMKLVRSIDGLTKRIDKLSEPNRSRRSEKRSRLH